MKSRREHVSRPLSTSIHSNAANMSRPASRPPSGNALDAPSQAYFESRFGHDFSEIRVHADADADRDAQALEARAFTVGQDIFFRAGAYDPTDADGLHLLAHEVAHAASARPARAGADHDDDVTISEPSDASEMSAERDAQRVMLGLPAAEAGAAAEASGSETASVQRFSLGGLLGGTDLSKQFGGIGSAVGGLMGGGGGGIGGMLGGIGSALGGGGGIGGMLGGIGSALGGGGGIGGMLGGIGGALVGGGGIGGMLGGIGSALGGGVGILGGLLGAGGGGGGGLGGLLGGFDIGRALGPIGVGMGAPDLGGIGDLLGGGGGGILSGLGGGDFGGIAAGIGDAVGGLAGGMADAGPFGMGDNEWLE